MNRDQDRPVNRRELDTRLAALHQLLDARDKATAIALDKATEALDIRLERMNEFRDQITTERAEYARKDQVDQMFSAQRQDIRQLQDRQTKAQGRDLGLFSLALTVGVSIGIAAAKYVIG